MNARRQPARPKHRPRFCTWCGARVPLTSHGRPAYWHLVYGLISEPRCSAHMSKPVVDVEAQRTISRMGDVVVAYRMEHGLTASVDEQGRIYIGGGLPPEATKP